jgi:hypothetical protein
MDDQIKKDEMGRVCSAHEVDVKYMQSFGRKSRREKTTWKI